MEQTKLCTVTVGETARAYPYGTTYQTLPLTFRSNMKTTFCWSAETGSSVS